MSQEIVDAIKLLEREKGIDSETLMTALEDALLSAYKKSPGSAKYARVELDRESGDFLVFELLVPEDLEDELLDEVYEQESTIDPETGERRIIEEPDIAPEKLAEYSDQIPERDVTPENFGRIAAQTAKQVVYQRIREAERTIMYDEYHDRVGELITGIVQQTDHRYTLVQLRERVEALLPKSEQVPRERYEHGARIKAVITDVSADTKGPSIVVSRRNPELIRKLFELEVPEVADGLVEIQNVAREPGFRSKIAVVSHADGVDPVGACVGPRGSRVRMVVSELRGEKIDIIPYNEEPARFVAKALAPARVREVLVDDENQQATVIVPDDQLSLAIGREGQNARLAARLTGWRIDIRSESDFAVDDDGSSGGGEEGESESAGRCHAILTNGRLCPNASLPGSRYCGLPAHQALLDQETDYVDPSMADAIEAADEGEGPEPAIESELEADADNETLDEVVTEGELPEAPIEEADETYDPEGGTSIEEEGNGGADAEEGEIEVEAIVEAIEDAPLADEAAEEAIDAAEAASPDEFAEDSDTPEAQLLDSSDALADSSVATGSPEDTE
ncbi:MAG: transcription termination/antitermination protein NusA [Thermoleophilaceae bacterium]|nr:transcription termination/antitermination protein NusA [Thermoleophilaceae bacterium]